VPVVGTAGATFIMVSILAIANGIADAMRRGGADDIAVVLHREAQIEMSSRLSDEDVAALTAALNAMPSNSEGRVRLVSPELVQTVDTLSRGGEAGAQVLARGISAAGIGLRREFRVVQGRPFTAGKLEVIVGRRLARDFAGLTVGTTLTGSTQEWSIVGVFEDGGGTAESEVWMDLDSARTESGSRAPISSLRVQLLGESDLGALREAVRRSPQLQVQVAAEREHQSRLFSRAVRRVRLLAVALALLLGIGAAAASMNAMSAAIVARERLVATLRALGFSPFITTIALFLEAMLLGLLGGALGAGFALLVADGYGLSVLNQATSTPLALSAIVTSASVAQGIALAAILSAIAAIAPCVWLARISVVSALNIR
jgi:putative ABC transport system permease protein